MNTPGAISWFMITEPSSSCSSLHTFPINLHFGEITNSSSSGQLCIVITIFWYVMPSVTTFILLAFVLIIIGSGFILIYLNTDMSSHVSTNNVIFSLFVILVFTIKKFQCFRSMFITLVVPHFFRSVWHNSYIGFAEIFSCRFSDFILVSFFLSCSAVTVPVISILVSSVLVSFLFLMDVLHIGFITPSIKYVSWIATVHTYIFIQRFWHVNNSTTTQVCGCQTGEYGQVLW